MAENKFQKLNWMIHFHQVNLTYLDLVDLIDMMKIQWMVDFYYILEMTFQLNSNMILELILKICQLKLICEIENGFSMALTIHIKAKF